ncbi:hypothetical protein ACTQ2U_04040 [Atopobiaceae bacterium LCP21S3_F7]
MSFSRRGSFAERLATTDWRVFVALAAIVLVIIVFAVGISSCVRGSTPARSSEGADDSADITSTAAMSDQDGRVAAGVSNSIISQFSTELDRDEQLAQIAKRANEYTDERLLQLALNEPEAIGFVANYLDADKSSSAYTDSVTKGSVPKLFDWDERWGYVTYGDGPIAVTGSGPTTLSMAYMGLTGLNNMTAANFASLDSSSQTSANGTSTANGSSSSSSSKDSDSSTTSSDSSTTSTGDSALDAMIKMATGAGLTASQLSVSSSNLTGYLSESSVIAVHLKANSLTADEHWALAVGVDSDGSVILFDPTSSSISSRTWAAGTIANYSSSFMLLSVTDESLASLQSKAGSSGTSASGTSTSGANGSATSGSSSTSGTNASGTGSSGTGSSGSGSSTSGTSGSASDTGSSSSGSGSGSSGTSSGSGSGSSFSGSTSSGSGNYVGLTKSGN